MVQGRLLEWFPNRPPLISTPIVTVASGPHGPLALFGLLPFRCAESRLECIFFGRETPFRNRGVV